MTVTVGLNNIFSLFLLIQNIVSFLHFYTQELKGGGGGALNYRKTMVAKEAFY